MDQQQPEKEWVAGMAHQHVEGAQLEQIGRDVTETEKRIKLLDSQAVRAFFPVQGLCLALSGWSPPCLALSTLPGRPTGRLQAPAARPGGATGQGQEGAGGAADREQQPQGGEENERVEGAVVIPACLTPQPPLDTNQQIERALAQHRAETTAQQKHKEKVLKMQEALQVRSVQL